jgi:hypothetical protein
MRAAADRIEDTVLRAQKTEADMRSALESCRHFFDTIDSLHAVEGPDQRFVRKAKGHCWSAKWEVVAALEGRTVEEVIREHIQQRIDDQLPDKGPHVGGAA